MFHWNISKNLSEKSFFYEKCNSIWEIIFYIRSSLSKYICFCFKVGTVQFVLHQIYIYVNFYMKIPYLHVKFTSIWECYFYLRIRNVSSLPLLPEKSVSVWESAKSTSRAKLYTQWHKLWYFYLISTEGRGLCLFLLRFISLLACEIVNYLTNK